jgi:hypothetical protein
MTPEQATELLSNMQTLTLDVSKLHELLRYTNGALIGIFYALLAIVVFSAVRAVRK